MFRIYLIIGAVFLVVLGAFGLYFRYAEGEMANLNQQISGLTVENDTLHTTVDSMMAQSNEVQSLLSQNNDEVNKIRDENQQLLDKLAKTDLKAMAAKHPQMVQDIINKQTAQFFKELQDKTK